MCSKPFQSLGGRICPECLNKIDQDFITVRDYIYDNPHSHMDKVSEETGVDKATILYLLKEGRLTLDSPDSEGALVCDMCKKPISTGRLCKECKEKVTLTMNKNIGGNEHKQPEKKSANTGQNAAKMHTDVKRS